MILLRRISRKPGPTSTRLDQIFELFDEKPKVRTCEAVKGILKDDEYVIDLDADADVKDAALIAAAQEAEHFEIAAYGTVFGPGHPSWGRTRRCSRSRGRSKRRRTPTRS